MCYTTALLGCAKLARDSKITRQKVSKKEANHAAYIMYIRAKKSLLSHSMWCLSIDKFNFPFNTKFYIIDIFFSRSFMSSPFHLREKRFFQIRVYDVGHCLGAKCTQFFLLSIYELECSFWCCHWHSISDWTNRNIKQVNEWEKGGKIWNFLWQKCNYEAAMSDQIDRLANKFICYFDVLAEWSIL
jgi:hypothetical protein